MSAGSNRVAADSDGALPEAGESSQATTICNGSKTLTLLVTEQRNAADFQFYRGWGFSYFWFLAIDGQCNYWVMGQPGVYGVRRGTLDSATADYVASALNLDTWDALYPKSVPGVVDQGVVTMTWKGQPLTCPLGGCNNDQVDSTMTAAIALRDDLGASAADLTTTGVVSVRQLDPASPPDFPPPAKLDAMLVGRYSSLPTDGDFRLLEVSDEDTLAWLRQQRDDFFARSFPVDLELTIALSDGKLLGMAYRDRVPFENLYGVFE